MSMGQRVIAVIGLAAAFAVGWWWWQLGELTQAAGWFAYEPGPSSTDTYYIHTQRRWEDLAVPLGLVGAWTVVSIWLLAPTSTATADRRGA